MQGRVQKPLADRTQDDGFVKDVDDVSREGEGPLDLVSGPVLYDCVGCGLHKNALPKTPE